MLTEIALVFFLHANCVPRNFHKTNFNYLFPLSFQVPVATLHAEGIQKHWKETVLSHNTRKSFEFFLEPKDTRRKYSGCSSNNEVGNPASESPTIVAFRHLTTNGLMDITPVLWFAISYPRRSKVFTVETDHHPMVRRTIFHDTEAVRFLQVIEHR